MRNERAGTARASQRRLPDLMALLLDLPDNVLSELAAAWECEPRAMSLYRTMTDPDALERRVATLPATASAMLRALARSPAEPADLLVRLPYSEGAFARDLLALGRCGLVLLAPTGEHAPPRLVRSAAGSGLLYVSADIRRVLAASRGVG